MSIIYQLVSPGGDALLAFNTREGAERYAALRNEQHAALVARVRAEQEAFGVVADFGWTVKAVVMSL